MAPEAEATLLMTGAVRRPMEIVQRNGPIGSFLALVAPAPEADEAPSAPSPSTTPDARLARVLESEA